MSDSVWPHRWQPIRLPVPGILQARTLEWIAISFSNAWKWKGSRSVVSNSSLPHRLQPTRLLHPWEFPGKSTGVGCHHLLRDFFLFSSISREVIFPLYKCPAAAAKSLQSCPTLCDPVDGNPPGSPIPGILQARTPDWVAISFSDAWKWKVKVKSLRRNYG